MSLLCIQYKSNMVRFKRMGLSHGNLCVGSYKTFDDAFRIYRKNEQPKFGAKLDQTHWMIYADFDRLPDDFIDWDAFGAYLESFQRGCVVDTLSGKKKLILHVESDAMTPAIAYWTFKKYLGDLADLCDRSAFCHSYILPSQFQIISDYLNNSRPVIAVRDTESWRMINIPSFDGISGLTKKVLQFFTSSRLDVVDGSQRYMSELFQVSQSAVSQAIKKLIVKGFIEIVDSGYIVGVRAKSYKVINSICVRTREISLVMKAAASIHLSELPTEIQPGSWYNTIWASTRFFTSAVQFVSWASGLVGVNLKGRFKRCIQAWNAHALKNGLDLVKP